MNRQQLVRLSIGLVVLLALWGGLAAIRRAGQDSSPRFALPHVVPDSVDSIVVTRSTDSVRMTKHGDAWEVNGHPAAEGSARDLISSINDTAATSELTAESAASHARLGVDSAAGKRLRLFGGGKLLTDLVLGNRGPDFEGAYIRRSGESAVYLLRSRVAELVDRHADDWRDKLIAKVETDSVGSIEVVRGKKGYALKQVAADPKDPKKGASWSLDGAPADSAQVVSLLGQLRAFSASGFPTPAQLDSLSFKTPKRRVRLLGQGGKTLVALVFDSTAAGMWVRNDSGGTVYRLDQYRADQATPADSVFRKKK